MVIELNSVGRKYQMGQGEFWALKDVTLSVPEGQLVTILGPSGSGKSTLLNIMGGIDRADAGTVRVAGIDLSHASDSDLTQFRRDTVGFVFQFFNLIPNLTVQENIEVTASIVKKPLPMDDILQAVTLSSMANRFPAELSGGEQQRVSLARAVVKNPALLLADEPTGSLDFATSRDILRLLVRVNELYHTTIVLVTHNVAIADMTDRLIRLRSGEIEEDRLVGRRIKPEEVTW
ncbi:MAG: ABC transporter ATP-binding protein [Caldiserica bacterium]|jgi:putative ABC transport system ATP-binding protein|nr:ABC transporter ATP-binding protein [Caldisericota bacterium]